MLPPQAAPAPSGPPPAGHGPYPSLLPRTRPPAGCAARPAGCAALAPSSPCASGPGRSRPLGRAAWSNTRRPAAGERPEAVRWGSSPAAEPPDPHVPRKRAQREAERTARQEATDGSWRQKSHCVDRVHETGGKREHSPMVVRERAGSNRSSSSDPQALHLPPFPLPAGAEGSGHPRGTGKTRPACPGSGEREEEAGESAPRARDEHPVCRQQQNVSLSLSCGHGRHSTGREQTC